MCSGGYTTGTDVGEDVKEESRRKGRSSEEESKEIWARSTLSRFGCTQPPPGPTFSSATHRVQILPTA